MGRAKAIPCVLIALNEGTRTVLQATIKLIINTIHSIPHSSRIAFRSSIVSKMADAVIEAQQGADVADVEDAETEAEEVATEE